MLAFKTILHPTDFSEPSAFAFKLACALARDHGARLVVLHVLEVPAAVGAAEGPFVPVPAVDWEALQEKLRRLQPPDPAVPVEHRLVEGYAASRILRLAEEVKADLIVMGTHGRRGLGRLLMGSVAEQVVRKAPCPVVTVKSPPRREEPSGEGAPALAARAEDVAGE
jgi:nucleotide-binding universal stress UspA family protein